MKGNKDACFTSDSAEWYTPAHVIEAVLAVLGTIDLDPCSNSHAAPIVPAVRHYTAADDGLAQPWHGRVFMNPPYGRRTAERWVTRLLGEYAAGRVTEAVALLPARTCTRWYYGLRPFVVCFVRGRLRFSYAGTAAPFPSLVVYLGPHPARFAAVFGKLGDVRLPATGVGRARHDDCEPAPQAGSGPRAPAAGDVGRRCLAGVDQ